MLESIKNPERIDETDTNKTELVYGTEVSGFQNCELINNQEISSYLKENIPPSHLEGCPSIIFNPYHPQFIFNPSVMGCCYIGSNEIYIGNEYLFEGNPEQLKSTVTHEIGHSFYNETVGKDPSLSRQWANLNSQSWETYMTSGYGFVSAYARSNLYEDFAESYSAYICNPLLLKLFSPDKYFFFRDSLFAGREY